MIKIIDAVPCAGTKIESDPWIPLKVSWLPSGQRQPLYLRISGHDGGEVECKVDPISGSLMQFILLLPPKSMTTISEVHLCGDQNSLMVPVVDRSLWGTIEGDSDWDALSGSIVKVESTISLKKARNGVHIDIGSSNAICFVRAGDAETGYAADGRLASVTAAFDTETVHA